jgi:hypothetical protein
MVKKAWLRSGRRSRTFGADDYLTKLIDFEMLDTVIQNRLRRSQGSRRKSDYHLTDREREVLTWVGRGKTSSRDRDDPRSQRAHRELPLRSGHETPRCDEPCPSCREGGLRTAFIPLKRVACRGRLKTQASSAKKQSQPVRPAFGLTWGTP